MHMMTKMLAGVAGVAGIASAAPVAAQYYPYSSSGYSQYNPYNSSRYSQYSPYSSRQYTPYSNYGAYGVNASVAEQQCTAAVQNRLYNRTSLGSILGSLVGIPTNSYGRVTGITSLTPTRSGMQIRGVASSGRYASNGYGAYGAGAYGALGYNMSAASDLSWRCDVDSRGYVRNVDVNRRY